MSSPRRTSKNMSRSCEWRDSPERHGLEGNQTHCSRKVKFRSCVSKRQGHMSLHAKAESLLKAKREL